MLPGFEITDANAELIGQLCRRLDGLPLAIELAAAKIRVMAVSQVLAGLDDVFKLLVGGRHGAPVRHQTLRAALDWSYDTLRLAGALAPFWYLRGHYREGRDWLDWALAAPGGAPAAVRAKALGDSGMLAHLQCEYPAAVRRLEAALALHRELGDRRGAAGILQALGSVAREQSRYARARELHAEALTEFEALGDPHGAANAHDALGFAAWLQGDFGTATAECTQALSAFTELGDAEGAAGAELNLGVAAMYRGEHETAATYQPGQAG